MRQRGAIEKAEWRQRHMIGLAAVEALSIGFRAHALVSFALLWNVVNEETGSRSVTSEFSIDDSSA